MAQFRQSGADRFGVRIHADAADRIPHRPARIRRPGKSHRRLSFVALVVALTLVLLVALAAYSHLSSPRKGFARDSGQDDDGTNETEFRVASNQSKRLKFGRGSGKIGRDSRYWDGDDRNRGGGFGEKDFPADEQQAAQRGRLLESGKLRRGHISAHDRQDKVNEKRSAKIDGELYNEGGREELDSYNEDYETSATDESKLKQGDEDNFDDEYDDGIDMQHYDDETHDADGVRRLDEDDGDEPEKDVSIDIHNNDSREIQGGSIGDLKSTKDHKLSSSTKKTGSKRKSKRHRVSSSSCAIKLLNSTSIVEPLSGKKFARFSLRYTLGEKKPNGSETWEPKFAGHQTLEERERSFYASDQTMNCGFIKGPGNSPSSGFDISDDDRTFLNSCHIAVSSCIFGNSDRLRSPFSKTITHLSRKNVCFAMFVDESTLQTLLSEGQKMENGSIGLWKIVVVKNLPYTDMRRVGKIPKFLTHRLFPSARYSIWLDSKLRLQNDPYLILEYFLWRRGFEYAISNHYDRHCVWEEVMQNKKLNKYNHTIIDQQFQFYQSDGLRRFDPSDPKKLLPSYVPEGSFIVRAHTPMSNLFSCLWFNEVDRFTPRDQLSFAYTYLKLRRMNPGKLFHLNMFKDCERRSMAKLFHHRAEEKRNIRTDTAR
ncbi:uncharacterized protein LOC122002660 [Zingiber officinale]|uniref:uncharacterized protein LOC122002660 n=1 Tax=Zingiber officinale TaxID=94328 RepID=UPI001C4B2A16|nr:uncharacterized protein LOC122002660 [Zingiber officinale]